jgi:hypothetical protein
MPTQAITNKKKIIVHFSCQEGEEKKKYNQSITGGNPTMICPHMPLHVEEGTIVYLVIRRMTKFDFWEASHVFF